MEGDDITEDGSETTEEPVEDSAPDDRLDVRSRRLHNVLVEATGKLQDATDLPYDETHLDDPAKLNADIDALLAAKPHLKKVPKVAGDAGVGKRGQSAPVGWEALGSR